MMAFSVMRADFLQRLRTPSFGIVLLVTAFLSLLLFPSMDAGYATVNLYGYRGIYNSAWIGDTIVAIICVLMPLFAFYPIKNAIELDRRTDVRALLVSNGIGNFDYIIGKWMSNISLLVLMALMMNVMGIIKQLYLGEDYNINLIDQFRTQFVIGLPVLMVISGCAILFESLPILRGGIGNMFYVLVWMILLIVQTKSNIGIVALIDQMKNGIRSFDRKTENVSLGGVLKDGPLETFDWSGAVIDIKMVQSMLIISCLAAVLVLMSMLLFRHRARSFNFNKILRKKTPSQSKRVEKTSSVMSSLSSVPGYSRRFSAMQILRGELRLIFRSQSRYWYLGLIGLWLLAGFQSFENIVGGVLLVSALWSTLALSSLGCRDIYHGMRDLTACTPHSEASRLLAAWLAGVVLQIFVFSGILIRLTMAGEDMQIITLLTASLFIPAFAIFLGRFSGSMRAFEFLYVLIWYAGPVDRKASFDFLGTTLGSNPPAFSNFLMATAIMLTAVFLVGFREPIGRLFLKTG